ncbi:NAD(P)H-dependent flavin oxidoreductase [Myroides injenensis]|uniref:NAD(P)H-dependent flavin oxidoreductase n=1 Tax=Myroides injenensis TaxID=1183151 RepID=UPI000287F22F|nr:nitronate monooxygenase [Myroides injenensis]
MKQLNDILGIKYLIGQAPMLGISTPEMVAEIANAGGLGILPLGGLAPEVCDKLIAKTKTLTKKPFAVNLFLNPVVDQDLKIVEKMQDFIAQYCSQQNIPFDYISDFRLHSYEFVLDIIQKHEINIISFTFGCLRPSEVVNLHQNGKFLIGTATTKEEAKYLEEANIDAIVLQGIEAGGHRGSFLSDSYKDNLSLQELFKQVLDCNINRPLIVAGGLYSGKTAREYIENGASLALFGSIFIPSVESNAIPYQKELLDSGKPLETRLTRAYSGKWARGIVNDFMEAIDSSELTIPFYPFQNSLTQNIRIFAKQKNIHTFNSLWCGTNSHYARKGYSKDIFNKLIQEFYEL